MMMLARTPAISLITAMLLLTGCAAGSGAEDPEGIVQGFPITVENCGVQVTFDAPPQGVLTIGTNAVRNLHAAGAGDRIVARSGEFGADLGGEEVRAAFADVPVVDPSDPTAETISGTGANLVIGYGLFSTSKVALDKLGIETLNNLADCGHDANGTATGYTVGQVLIDIERFGRVFGTQQAATAAVVELRAELDQLAAQRPAESATALIISLFGGRLSSHGGKNVSHDMLNHAGYTNVFADQKVLFLEPSLESIIDSDPDYLVINYGVGGETSDEARTTILSKPGIADLRAVKEGRIIGVPYDGLTATPGAIDGIRLLIEGRAK